MKKIIIILMISLFIVSCDKPIRNLMFTEICETKYIHIKAKFILSCIKNGNPKSDEEPEDLVYECRRTANNIFVGKCNSAFYYTDGFRHVSPVIPCSKAKTKGEHEICGAEYYKE